MLNHKMFCYLKEGESYTISKLIHRGGEGVRGLGTNFSKRQDVQFEIKCFRSMLGFLNCWSF